MVADAVSRAVLKHDLRFPFVILPDNEPFTAM